MSAYSFVKETNGFSITKDGLKVRYGDITYRAFPKGDVAQIQIAQFMGGGLSNYDVDVVKDTITVNAVAFDGTATELLDDLGDTVLFNSANGSGGAVSLILTSPDSTNWLVGVSDLGALTTVETASAGVASITLTSPNETQFTLGVNNVGALTTEEII